MGWVDQLDLEVGLILEDDEVDGETGVHVAVVNDAHNVIHVIASHQPGRQSVKEGCPGPFRAKLNFHI